MANERFVTEKQDSRLTQSFEVVLIGNKERKNKVCGQICD